MATRNRKRRGPGEGSIYCTKTGQWKVALRVFRLDGSRKLITRNAKSQRHGQVILHQLREQYLTPTADPGAMTVETMVKQCMASLEGDKATRGQRDVALEQRIIPLLGPRIVSTVDTPVISEWIQAMREAGSGDRSVQIAFSLLKRAFAWAQQAQIIDRNPCDGVQRPSAKREPIEPFSPAEVKLLLKETKNYRYHAFFVLALTTGMRQGELFGLQWDDINWDKKTITIRRQARDYRGKVDLKPPKTSAGVRTISIAGTAVEALRARLTASEAEGNSASQFVFCSPRGAVTRRTTFGKRVWRPLLERLQISHRGAHHLRHTSATMMLQRNVPPHIMAGVLGHASPETVMNVYAHFIPNDSAVAASAMADIVPETT